MFESKKTIEIWAGCGDDYYFGRDGEQVDYQMAAHFYFKAMKKKHSRATYMLGICHELGNGVEKDPEYAEILYQKAALLGDPDAKERLKTGIININAPAEPDIPAPSEKAQVSDYAEAVNDESETEPKFKQHGDFERAAQYEREGSMPQAYDFYKKAAEAGNAEACLKYSKKFSISEETADPEEEILWLEKAVALGSRTAEQELEICKKNLWLVKGMLDMRGKESGSRKPAVMTDREQIAHALELNEQQRYEEAAVIYFEIAQAKRYDESWLDAAMLLGLSYMSGKGIPQDLGKAHQWLIAAKEHGAVKADQALEMMLNYAYKAADDKVAAGDYAGAASLYEYVAGQTAYRSEAIAMAAFQLFRLSITDKSVSINADRALYWLERAVKLNNGEAVEAHRNLETAAADMHLSLAETIATMQGINT